MLALLAYDLPVGNMPASHGGPAEEALYLVPVGTQDRELDLQLYNGALPGQQLILVNDSEVGYASVTPEAQWGDIENILLGANQLALVETQSKYSDLTWGVRLSEQ